MDATDSPAGVSAAAPVDYPDHARFYDVSRPTVFYRMATYVNWR